MSRAQTILAGPPGSYCAAASPAPTGCPPGTANPTALATSSDGCRTCPPGTACPSFAVEPTPCAKGTYASMPGLGTCSICPAGTFQDGVGGLNCRICTAGHYCAQGSAAESSCPAGSYSDSTGLTSADQCIACPVGYFCAAASERAQPCRAGSVGTAVRLTEAASCTPCPFSFSSQEGSSECDSCQASYYSLNVTAVGSNGTRIECKACLVDAHCPVGTSLGSVQLNRGRWRLSGLARQTYSCRQHTDKDGTIVTPCRGNATAGEDGNGYCEAGHYGPRCVLCRDHDGARRYLSDSSNQCKNCPDVGSAVLIAFVVIAAVLLLVAAALLWLSRSPARFARRARMTYDWLRFRVAGVAIMPKLKILIAFYQSVVVIPEVYNVVLPDRFTNWLSFISWIQLQWTEFIVPGNCLSGGFIGRLLLRGLTPIGVLLVLPVVRPVLSLCQRRRAKQPEMDTPIERPMGPMGPMGSSFALAILGALPLMLFFMYCFITSIARGIFAAWSCEEFVADSTQTPAETRSFLRDDLRVECWRTREHEQIRSLAVFFVMLWPVAVPLTFLALVLPIRRALVERQATRLVRATFFLHREYEVSKQGPTAGMLRVCAQAIARAGAAPPHPPHVCVSCPHVCDRSCVCGCQRLDASAPLPSRNEA